MTTTKAKFSFRIDEYSTVGRFIYDAFVQNKADFADYTDFDDPFETDFKTALDAASATISPITVTNKLSVVTERLYNNTFTLRPILDKVDNYATNAGTTLNIKPKNFGTKEARATINKLDVEGLDGKLKNVLQSITENTAALTAKGFKPALTTQLQTLKKSIADDNAQ